MHGEQLTRAFQQPFAVRCQRNSARGSHEQLAIELALQAADVAAERLLCNEQACRSGCEVQVLRDRDEVPKRANIELAADRRDVVIHAVRMLIHRRQVLDAAARLADRELTSKRTQDPT